MSTESLVRFIFLPTSVLRYVKVGSDTPWIDPELVLEKGTTCKIRRIITSFHPYLIFDETARDNRQLLIDIFKKLVAKRLSFLSIPSHINPPTYFKAPLEQVSVAPRELEQIITSESDINADRLRMFSSFGIMNLRNGYYRLAADGIDYFIQTYKYLNTNKIHEIEAVHDIAQDALHDSTNCLTEAYKSVKVIKLLLKKVILSSNQNNKFKEELKGLRTKVNNFQLMFDRTVEQTGFIAALVQHHRNLYAKYQSDLPTDTISPLLKHAEEEVENQNNVSETRAAHEEPRMAFHDDVSDICDAHENSIQAVDKEVSLLANAHQAVEEVQLLLNSEVTILPTQREKLENYLARKIVTLNVCKDTTNRSLQENAHLAALLDYHLNPYVENLSDIAEDSNICPLSKDVGDTGGNSLGVS